MGLGGRGVGVNGHAHRYVLILPAKRVFFPSELRRHSEKTLHSQEKSTPTYANRIYLVFFFQPVRKTAIAR